MTRTASTTRTRPTRPTITRAVVVTALSIAAWFVAPLAAGPAQAHESQGGHTAAQQAYVASLVDPVHLEGSQQRQGHPANVPAG